MSQKAAKEDNAIDVSKLDAGPDAFEGKDELSDAVDDLFENIRQLLANADERSFLQ